MNTALKHNIAAKETVHEATEELDVLTELLTDGLASESPVGTALGAAISGAFVSTLGFDKLSWIGLPFA